MSYILEALKKSDQQRQRGTTPTLQAAQVTVAAHRRHLVVYYGLVAVMLLGAGGMIGWLRPWQPEQPPVETTASGTEHMAAKSPVVQQTAPAPVSAQPEVFGKSVQVFPAHKSTPVAQPVPQAVPAPAGTGTDRASAPVTEKAMPEKNAPEKNMPEKNATPASVAQEQRALSLAELPPQIQQELPAMVVQLHAYSSNPTERLVSINSIRLREGGSLAPGLTLEQITPDGMIFSYKGYRFQRGVR